MNFYVLYVCTGKELRVRDALIGAGYDARVPRERRLIRQHGQWVQKEYVLLAGYVFLGVEAVTDAMYYEIRTIGNVMRFLGIGAPEHISEAEAARVGLLTPTGEALEPSVIEFDAYGTPRVVSGILEHLPPAQLDRHRRRATVELFLKGTRQEIELSFQPKEPEDT